MSNLTDFLPDAICIVDASGNVKQSNIQYQKVFFRCPSELQCENSMSASSVNFVNDILHSKHQNRFFEALKVLMSDRFVGDDVNSVSLGYCMTYSRGSHKLHPICRLIHWTLSGTSTDDNFIIVGRNADIESVSNSQSKECPFIIGDSVDASDSTDPPAIDECLSEIELAVGRPLLRYLNSAPLPVTLLSDTGMVLWANDLSLSLIGCSRAEFIGHGLSEFLYPGEDGKLKDVMDRISAGDTVREAHLQFMSKSIQIKHKHILLDCNAVFNTRGEFSYARCFMRLDSYYDTKARIVHDNKVLARKHTESRTEFVRNVFHEIRTPMHVLSNFFCDSNPSREDFEDMKHHTGVILGIVDDLSFSTAFEASEIPSTTPVTQHLPTILAETFDAVKSIEQKAGGSVEIRLHCANLNPDIEEIITDPYFKRVLYCLLSNAVKYSPLNGFVDVTVSNSSSMSRTRTKPNTENSSGISTPKRLSGKESFISSLPAICEKFEKDSGAPTGYFTFHIRNSTVTPMNVPETTAFFKNYYHSTARGNRLGNQSSTGSIVDCPSSGNLLEFALMDRREGSTCSKSSSNQKFNDLQQYSGLGLGLYTAYNMVSLMGGSLECSVENEDEACFWFTIPALYYISEHLNQGQEEGDGSGSGDQLPDYEGIPNIAPTAIITTCEEIAEAAPVINIIDIEAPPTGNLFLTPPVATPTPSFARLSSTPPTSARASITEQHLDHNVLSESVRSSGSSSSGFSKQRILVVDDSRICQKVAGKALSGLEFVIDYASNGLEACVKLSEKPLRYDAVLMDLRMPIMDGITAIRKCRTELGLTKLPIIALTAEVGSSIKEEANKAGASWFLTKPAKVLELISVMRAFSFSK